MDRNGREKQMLYEWGSGCEHHYQFESIDHSINSYYIQRQPAVYIREYGFETIPEFAKELERLWENDLEMKQIMKVVEVAAIKNKIIGDMTDGRSETGDRHKKEKLPAYIYNF